MLKVYTSVFVVEDMKNAFEVVEEALERKRPDVEAGLRRHVVELHVKVEAPRGLRGGRD